MTVHEKWIAWLISQGYSQAEIARQADCSAGAVHRWAHGDREPSVRYRADLIRAINKMLKARGYRAIDVAGYYAGPERIQKR